MNGLKLCVQCQSLHCSPLLHVMPMDEEAPTPKHATVDYFNVLH